jgi:glyoxylase-like metal-dependent hydrolase (beta-lactamase superfamily II)
MDLNDSYIINHIRRHILEEKAKSQQYPAPGPVELKKIRENIYLATGGLGSNNGFYIGEDGVVAIDAKMDEASSAQALKLLRRITPLPVKHMILTHGDIDHVTGLTAYPEGMTIAAHEKAAVDIEKSGNAAISKYHPNVTFTDFMELNVSGKIIHLMNYGPGHTTGDSVVYFKDEKAAFVGDLVFIGREQIVHQARGGSVAGLIKNLGALVELEADIFFPGHYEIVTKSDIINHKREIEEKQAAVAVYIKEGRTLEEIKRAMGVKDAPIRPGMRVFPGIVECAYLELTAGQKG